MLDLALDSRVFLDSPLDCAIQEVDMILNTECTELLGDTQYGVSLDSFLWTLTPQEKELEKYIKDKLQNSLFIKQFKLIVKCKYLRGNYRSIYHVNILLMDNNGNKVKREYQFQ